MNLVFRSNCILFLAVGIFIIGNRGSSLNACHSPAIQQEEQTAAEFKEYVAGKMDLDDAQLDQVVALVDADGNGKISESEFEGRMTAVQTVLSGMVPDSDGDESLGEGGSSEDDSDDEKKEMDAEEKETGEVKEVVTIAPLVISEKAPILLITADEIATAWIPFAKWKTQNGKLTKIITVGQISQEFEADSIEEKIRLCVRQHIDENETRWVILGGDCLPNGKGLVPGGHKTVHSQERRGIPTDIVYLSETDWDADDDGIYGEFEDDQEAISYPDGTVGLGRIPVRTVEDVAAFTEKVVSYESNYPTTGFAENMVFTCTDQPAYPKVRNSWDGYLSKAWDGEMGRFFADETPWDDEGDPGSHALSAENLVELINQKTTGKIHIHGHGHLPAWVLEDSSFTEQHVGSLENEGAYPLLTTVSCNTGEYDSRNDPSIVEQMLRAPRAGSVAVVAPVRTGKPHFARNSDFELMITEGKLDGTTMTMTNYWTFGLGEGASTGHAMMKAKHALAEDATKVAAFHLCICELNLLGDPTLDMRAESPRNPELDSSVRELDSATEFTISTDAPGSTVCLWNFGDVYEVITADEEGTAVFVVDSEASEYTVTVSGSGLNSASTQVTR